VTPEPARPRLRGDHLLYGMLALLVIAVVPFVVVPTLISRDAVPELADLGTVPPFVLVDDAGERFTEDALRDHPTIVDFVFTRCDTICPVVTMKLQRVQDKTADRKGAAIKLLSISVDPEYDTPARLTEYAKRYSADPTRWRFVTGPVDQVRALVEGPFMNSMLREGVTAGGAPQISHNGYFVLVDGDLRIRGVYDSSDVQRLDELIHAARYLARTHRSYKFGQ
jgi:protein SCO1